jgi:hypothetical protein
MIRLPLLAALTLMTAAPSLPQAVDRGASAAEARSYRPIERIRWTYDDESFPGGTSRQLRFTHDRSNSSIGADGDPDVQRIVATIAHAAPGEDVTFSLAREAGTLACTGRAEEGGRGSGTCRFVPDNRFASALESRGIAPHDSDDMFALTLVDAHLATVDDLVGQGFRFDDAGDLIAVSALDVTPAYVAELRGGGLKVEELGDLIAAKALKVDAEWLRAMAQAGYPGLAVDQAIQMRALGVTPDYAVRMARVLRAVGEIE